MVVFVWFQHEPVKWSRKLPKYIKYLAFITSSCQGWVTVAEASGRWEDEDELSFFVSHVRSWLPSQLIWDWWTDSKLKRSFEFWQFLFEDSELELSGAFAARLWWTNLGILKFRREVASADQAGCLGDSGVADLHGAVLTREVFSIACEMRFVPEVVSLDKEDAEDGSASLRSLFAHKSFNSFPFSCTKSFSEVDLARISFLVLAWQFFAFLESFFVLLNIFCIFCSCSLKTGLFTLDKILWWDLSPQLSGEVACLWEQTLLTPNVSEDLFFTVLMPPTGPSSLTRWSPTWPEKEMLEDFTSLEGDFSSSADVFVWQEPWETSLTTGKAFFSRFDAQLWVRKN